MLQILDKGVKSPIIKDLQHYILVELKAPAACAQCTVHCPLHHPPKGADGSANSFSICQPLILLGGSFSWLHEGSSSGPSTYIHFEQKTAADKHVHAASTKGSTCTLLLQRGLIYLDTHIYIEVKTLHCLYRARQHPAFVEPSEITTNLNSNFCFPNHPTLQFFSFQQSQKRLPR